MEIDALVVGAGLAGLYMLLKLRKLLPKVQCFEAAANLGGTWYFNCYPGARCDVPSLEYSYSFDAQLQQEWNWTEKYSTQPEILKYLNHVAERFHLRDEIKFNTRVTSAVWQEMTCTWLVSTDTGLHVTTRYLVMATGCLSMPHVPYFKGQETFQGKTYNTAQWPHDPVPFAGKRVGVIGTGSSGVQVIPEIAKEASEVVVLQRSPVFSVPAQNRLLTKEEQEQMKAQYPEFRQRCRNMPMALMANEIAKISPPVSVFSVDEAERNRRFQECWDMGGVLYFFAFQDLALTKEANEFAAEFIRKKIFETVKDSALAEKLLPHYPLGCKRLTVNTNYFETYNKPHVRLVDISSQPIEEITPNGVKVGGVEHQLDILVYATGFDAMTGALTRIDIRGVDGMSLKEKWSAAGPETYLGLGAAGFPNLFIMTGPGSPSVLSNMFLASEQHAEWITDCIAHMRSKNLHRIEADAGTQAAWGGFTKPFGMLYFTQGCNSWYNGGNIPGKPRVYMPLLNFPLYVSKCDECVRNNYQGFNMK